MVLPQLPHLIGPCRVTLARKVYRQYGQVMVGRARAISVQPFSVTVVLGLRWAVAPVTYRPVIALRWWVPALLLPPFSTTDVRGCRAAAAFEMYRPLIALRALDIGPPQVLVRLVE